MKCYYNKNINCEKEAEWRANYRILQPITKNTKPCKRCYIPERIRREGLELKIKK